MVLVQESMSKRGINLITHGFCRRPHNMWNKLKFVPPSRLRTATRLSCHHIHTGRRLESLVAVRTFLRFYEKLLPSCRSTVHMHSSTPMPIFNARKQSYATARPISMQIDELNAPIDEYQQMKFQTN